MNLRDRREIPKGGGDRSPRTKPGINVGAGRGSLPESEAGTGTLASGSRRIVLWVGGSEIVEKLSRGATPVRLDASELAPLVLIEREVPQVPEGVGEKTIDLGRGSGRGVVDDGDSFGGVDPLGEEGHDLLAVFVAGGGVGPVEEPPPL